MLLVTKIMIVCTSTLVYTVLSCYLVSRSMIQLRDQIVLMNESVNNDNLVNSRQIIDSSMSVQSSLNDPNERDTRISNLLMKNRDWSEEFENLKDEINSLSNIHINNQFKNNDEEKRKILVEQCYLKYLNDKLLIQNETKSVNSHLTKTNFYTIDNSLRNYGITNYFNIFKLF
jgi:hypothetical protein